VDLAVKLVLPVLAHLPLDEAYDTVGVDESRLLGRLTDHDVRRRRELHD
jgi:hypothetical protein